MVFKPKDGSAAQTVVANAKVDSHLAVVRGGYQPEVDGTLVITFDNSFSRWTGKTLLYRVDVSHME